MNTMIILEALMGYTAWAILEVAERIMQED